MQFNNKLAPSCTPPVVAIEDVGESIDNPRQVRRMNLFSVNAEIDWYCKIEKQFSMYWVLYSVNVTTGEQRQMNISDNPTHDKSEILLMGNVLEYGMYRFDFYLEQFSVFLEESQALQLIRTSWIEIIPTQIAVFSVEAGLSEMEIGYDQPLILGEDN